MQPLHDFSMLLCCSSVTQPRPTLCYHMDCSTQASLSSLSQSWLKLMSIELVIASTISSSVPFSSCIQSFPASGSFKMSQLSSQKIARYWSLSFSISPSKEYSGLISFRMDWLDLLAVQETLKSLLQHHSSKASILQ